MTEFIEFETHFSTKVFTLEFFIHFPSYSFFKSLKNATYMEHKKNSPIN